MKILLVLVIGIAIGYSYGFNDAKQHEHNIVVRAVDRVGGSNRGRYGEDVDAQMRQAEKP